ncbi:Endonuclease/Exonuclease/phosphatase family protein [Massilia sp. PDC64]|nr:Endonuclease/Exonuclease/phosphatase family protein [Massilia sp. PDC64]
MTSVAKECINVAWWNAGNFYHFDQEKAGRSRWPQSQNEYDAKMDSAVQAIEELIHLAGKPDVFFLCEITANALAELRDRVFQDYRVISLDVKKDSPTLQVGVMFRPNSQTLFFSEQPPVVVASTPNGTRPMLVLDAATPEFKIRLIGCHWQSRFDEHGSDRVRFRLADNLATYAFDFLSEKPGFHHTVILGDLNEEPFEHNLGTLYAHRNRNKSKAKAHWADEDVKRVHLYNTSWRLLGEKFAHPIGSAGTGFDDCAGTYYWESQRTWHHFDHIIVSGGLLQNAAPYFNEDDLHIVSSPKFLFDGLPIKFHERAGVYHGLSDHLPLVCKIYIK